MDRTVLFQLIDVAKSLMTYPHQSKLKFNLLKQNYKGVNNDLWFIPANLQR